MGPALALLFYGWGKAHVLLIDDGGRAWEQHSIGICGLMTDQVLNRGCMMKDIFLPRLFWRCLGEQG